MTFSPALSRSLFCLFLFASRNVAALPWHGLRLRPPPPSPEEFTSHTHRPTSYFEQLIDHDNPGLGTFSQRYYSADKFYKGSGSPVVLVSSGENKLDHNAFLFTKQSTLPGLFAQPLAAQWSSSSTSTGVNQARIKISRPKHSSTSL